MGFGPTATMRRSDVTDQAFDHHVDVVARLAEAAPWAPDAAAERR